ncbi:MAG TPA: hypothetical protein VHP83_05120 [Aggregatilineaceae bacterium]|nr:hypothetical protein [Aggregatilineaceae bacterium]
MRNVVMPFVFLFFPPFPRRLTRKYRKLGYSPENLVNYIEELKTHPQFETWGGPPTLSPAYDLLQGSVWDYQADELRFTTDPDEVYLLHQHELAILGSEMYTHQALQNGYESSLSQIEKYLGWCRQEMPRIIQYNPVLKHWVTIIKDTPEELIVVIGKNPSL